MNLKLNVIPGLAAVLMWQLGQPAAADTVSASTSPDATIPDDDLNGLASIINVSAPFDDITSVELTLNITGGFNGDDYAYLQYSSGLVVLLNNVGSNVSNPYGSPGSGFNVTFNDPEANINTAPETPGVPLTGSWAPQQGFLSTFNGLNPNGAWTLFIADEQAGGVGTLQSWSLQVTDSSFDVADGGNTAELLAFGAGLLVLGSSRGVQKGTRSLCVANF